MKKLEFTTEKGEFIIEEASDKNLGRVLVKYMTEEQFAEVVDDSFDCWMALGYKDYENDNAVYVLAKESFESLIKSLGWYLFENPVKVPMHKSNNINDMSKHIEAESKTFYNPILLKKV